MVGWLGLAVMGRRWLAIASGGVVEGGATWDGSWEAWAVRGFACATAATAASSAAAMRLRLEQGLDAWLPAWTRTPSATSGVLVMTSVQPGT